jgi:hypothetical protein
MLEPPVCAFAVSEDQVMRIRDTVTEEAMGAFIKRGAYVGNTKDYADEEVPEPH